MTTAALTQESPKEAAARAALEAKLQPGESLLEYTLGKSSLGGLFSNEFHIGLTDRRLLIFRTRKPDELYSIHPQFIKKLSFKKSVWSASANGLSLEFPGESLTFASANKPWKQHAQALADRYNQSPPAPAQLSTEEVLKMASSLRDLGQLVAAETYLKEAMQADPTAKTDPAIISTVQQLGESKLALQVGAGIFTAVLVFLVFLAILGLARLNPIGIAIILYCMYNLWRARYTWRGTGLFFAVLNAGLNLVLNISAGSVLDIIMWVSFGVAMILVLTGKSSRVRTLIAVGIFAVGFLGVFVFALILGAMNAA